MRRYDPSGAFWGEYGTGLAGTADGDIPGPNGTAVIASTLYVLDTVNDRVQAFDVNTAAAAGFWALPTPADYYGIAAGPDGNLYIGSWTTDQVSVYTPAGALVRNIGTPGTGDGQLTNPTDIAFDSLGYVYISELSNARVSKFSQSGTFIRKIVSGTFPYTIASPFSIAIDRADMLWVGTSFGITRFDQKGTAMGTYAASDPGIRPFPGGLSQVPRGIAVVELPNEQPLVFIADFTYKSVSRFHLVARPYAHVYKAQWGSAGAGDGQFQFPRGIAVDKNGYVYVTDNLNHRIQKFDRYGNFVQNIGKYGSGYGNVYWPYGIAVDNAHNLLYVTDAFLDRVTVFTTTGLVVRQWGGTGTGDGQLSNPTGIALDDAGLVYVTEGNNNRIQKFDAYGNFLTKWGTTGTGNGELQFPNGIAVDSARGLLYVTESTNNRLQVFTLNGTFVTIFDNTGPRQLSNPTGVALNGRGTVYITDAGNNRVAHFDTNGFYVGLDIGSAGSGNGEFTAPGAVAVDPATGQVYVLDTNNNRVQRFGAPNTKYDTVGIYRPAAKTFYLRKQNTTGFADFTINLGAWSQSTDLAVSGDWNCDGIDTVGLYRQSNGTFYLRDNNRAGNPHYTIAMGGPGDLPVVGDWNGDGCDGIGVYRPTTNSYFIKNVVEAGPVDAVMYIGTSTDRPVAGDWNGDGQDTPGVYRPSQSRFYLTDAYNPFGTLTTTYNVLLGNPNDVGFSGDFNEQGSSGIGVFRPTNGITYMKFAPTSGFANISMIYGIAGDGIVAGEWGPVPGESTPATAPQESAPIFEPGK